MVTQAEHIPVHLGAMPEAVAAVRAHDPAPGEPWILNDPYAGGTHLPDLTIVTRTSLGYAVSRAHHADVGGAEPGQPSGRVDDARGGRGGDPADATRRHRRSSDLVSPDAQPGRAPRRPSCAARGAHARRPQGRRALRSTRTRARLSRDGRAPRVLGARRLARRSRELPDGTLRGSRRARDAGRAARAPGRRDDRRRLDRHRLRRNRAPASRQPQLPARGHPLRLLLRRPLPDRARSSGFGGRVHPGHRSRARGLSRQRPALRPRSPRATRRRRAGSSTSSSPRSRTRSPFPHRDRGR